jgi:iron complex transport system ATP-binding protein
MAAPPLLELRNATLYQDASRVLDGITLTINSGEHTAIVGPNGAGKSSLIRLLTVASHAVATDDGSASVRIFGRDRWDVSELRKRLGIVSADLHTRFTQGTWTLRVTGLEAVVSGFFGSQAVFDHHEPTRDMRVAAMRALALVGAGHLAERRLHQMSTGEARRVLIARALVTTPDALVLDEPTAGLDVVARHQFMERVRELARGHTTLVLVTQHIDEIVPEIGRVILIQNGRIAADGPKDTIVRGGALERVFGAPLTVEEADGYYYVRPRASVTA